MPPLSIRLTDDERDLLDREARQAGVKPSTYVRLLIRGEASEREQAQLEAVTDDHERRLSRLEEMAGL